MARRAHGRAWVVGKYALLQLPSLILVAMLLAMAVRWWDISPRVAVGVLALWVAKDILLFPLLRVAYESGGAPGGADAMVGTRGVSSGALAPTGVVRVGAELWSAELEGDGATLPSGAPVRVRAVRGLTLLVEPDSEQSAAVGPQ